MDSQMDGDDHDRHVEPHIDTSFEAMKVIMMMVMIMLVRTIIVTVSTSMLKETKQPPKVWLCHHSSSHPCPPSCQLLCPLQLQLQLLPILVLLFLSTAVPSSTSHFSQKVFSSRVLEFPEEKFNNQNTMTLSGIGA